MTTPTGDDRPDEGPEASPSEDRERFVPPWVRAPELWLRDDRNSRALAEVVNEVVNDPTQRDEPHGLLIRAWQAFRDIAVEHPEDKRAHAIATILEAVVTAMTASAPQMKAWHPEWSKAGTGALQALRRLAKRYLLAHGLETPLLDRRDIIRSLLDTIEAAVRAPSQRVSTDPVSTALAPYAEAIGVTVVLARTHLPQCMPEGLKKTPDDTIESLTERWDHLLFSSDATTDAALLSEFRRTRLQDLQVAERDGDVAKVAVAILRGVLRALNVPDVDDMLSAHEDARRAALKRNA